MTKVSVYTQVRQLDKHKCRSWGCGKRWNTEVHHIIPRSQGGPDKEWNLITLCPSCHNKITEGKSTDIKLLTPLKKKRDFRWKKALEWHLNRKQLKNEKFKNIKSRSPRTD